MVRKRLLEGLNDNEVIVRVGHRYATMSAHSHGGESKNGSGILEIDMVTMYRGMTTANLQQSLFGSMRYGFTYR